MPSPWWIVLYVVVLGALALGGAALSSWNFDRKHPHLTRKAMRAREAADAAETRDRDAP